MPALPETQSLPIAQHSCACIPPSRARHKTDSSRRFLPFARLTRATYSVPHHYRAKERPQSSPMSFSSSFLTRSATGLIALWVAASVATKVLWHVSFPSYRAPHPHEVFRPAVLGACHRNPALDNSPSRGILVCCSCKAAQRKSAAFFAFYELLGFLIDRPMNY